MVGRAHLRGLAAGEEVIAGRAYLGRGDEAHGPVVGGWVFASGAGVEGLLDRDVVLAVGAAGAAVGAGAAFRAARSRGRGSDGISELSARQDLSWLPWRISARADGRVSRAEDVHLSDEEPEDGAPAGELLFVCGIVIDWRLRGTAAAGLFDDRESAAVPGNFGVPSEPD